MRGLQRIASILATVAVAVALTGCGSMGSPEFDPTGLLDFLDTKKPLPGDRKPVFPEGVPGLEQGVPKELIKGNQQQQAETPPAVAEPPPPPEKKKPAKKVASKQKPKPRVQQAAPVDDEPRQPAPQLRPSTGAQPPEASPFPAPLPSGTFTR